MNRKTLIFKILIVVSLIIAIICLLIPAIPKFKAELHDKKYNEVLNSLYNHYYLFTVESRVTLDFTITKDNSTYACDSNASDKDFYIYLDKDTDRTFVITKINNKDELFEFKNKRLVAFPGQVVTLDCNKTYTSSIEAIYTSREDEIEIAKKAQKAQEELDEMERQKREYDAKYGVNN